MPSQEKIELDALTARVATLEALIVLLQGSVVLAALADFSNPDAAWIAAVI